MMSLIAIFIMPEEEDRSLDRSYRVAEEGSTKYKKYMGIAWRIDLINTNFPPEDSNLPFHPQFYYGAWLQQYQKTFN